MTPEERITKLEKQVEAIRSAKDIVFIEEIRRRLSGLTVSVQDGAATTGTSIAVRNAADTGPETVADDYAGVASLYSNGILIGRIGYYT